mmetsp:Transcript_25411/g.19149  ORF Transcript_25411/g.19149 Transcript_25411/m.19149 type:complete len:120 (-) Transcript_25411:79-438(-)
MGVQVKDFLEKKPPQVVFDDGVKQYTHEEMENRMMEEELKNLDLDGLKEDEELVPAHQGPNSQHSQVQGQEEPPKEKLSSQVKNDDDLPQQSKVSSKLVVSKADEIIDRYPQHTFVSNC